MTSLHRFSSPIAGVAASLGSSLYRKKVGKLILARSLRIRKAFSLFQLPAFGASGVGDCGDHPDFSVICPSAEFGWALPLRSLRCLQFKILIVQVLFAAATILAP